MKPRLLLIVALVALTPLPASTGPVFVLSSAPSASAVSAASQHGANSGKNARLLYAIVLVEGWQGGVGPHGERYEFQMLPGTRADRLKEFRARGETAPSERMLAAAHLEWLRRHLRRAEIDANVFNLALAWNAGLDAVLAGRAPVRSYNYAVRVANLCETEFSSK